MYSPHQVGHTGADHHNIKNLLGHDLIKTHIWVISMQHLFLVIGAFNLNIYCVFII